MQKSIRYRVKKETIDSKTPGSALIFIEDSNGGMLTIRQEGSEKQFQGRVERKNLGTFLVTLVEGDMVHRLDVAVNTGTEGAGSWDISVQGAEIDADLNAVRALGSHSVAPKASQDASQTQARAAMPGRVIAVQVKEGDLVAPGQALLVLEAMKMQNDVLAQEAGRVRKIHVKVGDNVERKALLVDIDH